MTIGDPSDWDDFFERSLLPAVFDHVVATWNRMHSPAPDDLEDAVSVKLYSALVRAKDRNSHPFLIRYQDVEVNTDLERVTGRKDIVFFPSIEQEEIYLCLEAKRLNATISGTVRSLADEYVKDGMKRYIDGKYASFVRHGAMLGYVLDGDLSRAMRNVENNIRNRVAELCMAGDGCFVASAIRPADTCAKETHHHRTTDSRHFCIHHLFVGPVTVPQVPNEN